MDRGATTALFAAVLVLGTLQPAMADHEVDQGRINGGVSSEEEARAYPCPRDAAGDWERSGPVVCLDKRTDLWALDADVEGNGCTYDATGWHGTCIFDIDEGDHIRVWGTRGIVWTPFTVTWHHDGSAPVSEPEPENTSSGGQGAGPGQPGSPGQPPPPPRPTAPEPPERPSDPDQPTPPQERPSSPGMSSPPTTEAAPPTGPGDPAATSGSGAEQPATGDPADTSAPALGDEGATNAPPWPLLLLVLVGSALGAGAILLSRRGASGRGPN